MSDWLLPLPPPTPEQAAWRARWIQANGEPNQALCDAIFHSDVAIVGLGMAGQTILLVREGADMERVWRAVQQAMLGQGVAFVRSDFTVEMRSSSWQYSYK